MDVTENGVGIIYGLDGKAEEAPPTNSMEYKWQEYFEEHLKEETGASIQEVNI